MVLLVAVAGCVSEPLETEETSALCTAADCGDSGVPAAHYDFYCAVPEIRWSQILDAHECNDIGFGCGRAFMYFAGYGSEKTGTIPSQ